MKLNKRVTPDSMDGMGRIGSVQSYQEVIRSAMLVVLSGMLADLCRGDGEHRGRGANVQEDDRLAARHDPH